MKPFQIRAFGYIFSPSIIPTLAVLILLPLLLKLGMWQLHRAEEKRYMQRDFATHHAPVAITAIKDAHNKDLRYRRIHAVGKFDNNHLIFLDNKTHSHQVGYHVFSPFHINNETRILLVDRGFVPSNNRLVLPMIPPILGSQAISGLVYFPSRAFMLKSEAQQKSWPLTLQAIDLTELPAILHQPVYPFYLLLQTGDEANLVRDWRPVSLPPYRHTAYAIQWFLLALTLTIIYLSLNISRAH